MTDYSLPRKRDRPGIMAFTGLDGWKLSKKHDEIMHREMKRLHESIGPLGYDVQYDFCAWRGTVGMPEGAFLHLYINGIGSVGHLEDGTRVRYDGVRVFGDELEEVTTYDYGADTLRWNRSGKSPGKCVNEVMKQLPESVNLMIRLFNNE